jgi:epoxyqueuosine reductase
MGNRVFGCDDCQLACPWNKFARDAAHPDFRARNGLDAPDLVELFGWSEPQYLERTEGSALRRLGYARWLRNLAVALGNAPPAARGHRRARGSAEVPGSSGAGAGGGGARAPARAAAAARTAARRRG